MIVLLAVCSIAIAGISNAVVITGHCASIAVSGVDSVVTVDSADTIGVSGFFMCGYAPLAWVHG